MPLELHQGPGNDDLFDPSLLNKPPSRHNQHQQSQVQTINTLGELSGEDKIIKKKYDTLETAYFHNL